jgi:drug/metabolite transporter (DMT)-like permease
MSNRVNWPLWSGFLLSIGAFLSYFFFFIKFPITRDIPWATLILFAVAIVLLIVGLRRAVRRRVLAWIVTILGVAMTAFFCLGVFVATKLLPASESATGVGAKAPDFVLLDTNRRPVSLAQLLAAPGSKGAVLIFYRGYW